MGDAIKTWDQRLPQAEFAHNHAVNKSTRFSPFRVVYGIVPRGPIDLGLAPDLSRDHGQAIDFVADISSIHAKVHDNLQLSSAKYKASADRHRRDLQFRVGDLVWAVLTRDIFLQVIITSLSLAKLVLWKFLRRSTQMPIVCSYHLKLNILMSST